MELPVRERVRDRRRRDDEDEKNLALIACKSDEFVMENLLDAAVWTNELVTKVLATRRHLSCKISLETALLLRRALNWNLPKLDGWLRHMYLNPNGNLRRWLEQQLVLQSPHSCLDLPNWRGKATILLRSGEILWYLLSEKEQPGKSLMLKFHCGLQRWFATLLISTSVKKAKFKLTVDITIQCGDARLTYWAQQNSFADAATYCLWSFTLQMPIFLLARVQSSIQDIYLAMIHPHLNEERTKLLNEIKSCCHFCRDIHPIILDFILPQINNPLFAFINDTKHDF